MFQYMNIFGLFSIESLELWTGFVNYSENIRSIRIRTTESDDRTDIFKIENIDILTRFMFRVKGSAHRLLTTNFIHTTYFHHTCYVAICLLKKFHFFRLFHLKEYRLLYVHESDYNRNPRAIISKHYRWVYRDSSTTDWITQRISYALIHSMLYELF